MSSNPPTYCTLIKDTYCLVAQLNNLKIQEMPLTSNEFEQKTE